MYKLAAPPLGREPTKSSLRYMPGLDVMRGLAILMVLFYHGFTSTGVFGAMRYGAMGVHLFFVLSGFLISGILLDSRNDRDYFRNFYMRRALRIVPAYLVILAVLKVTHTIDWRYLLVSLLYFDNMTAVFGSSPQYGPLWSLSVEEQFYLVWPLVVRHVSRRALLGLSLAIVALTPVLRFVLLYGPSATRDISYKTWDVGDFFAAGALLALALRSPQRMARLRRWILPLVLTGMAALALGLAIPEPRRDVLQKLGQALRLEPWLLLFTGMILFALLNPGIAKAWVARPLVFLANISYGLYLCHQLIFTAVEKRWAVDASSQNFYPILLLRFAVEAGISIAVATLSRRTLEEFFLRMKPKHQPAPAG